jgi:hypothetical protein
MIYNSLLVTIDIKDIDTFFIAKGVLINILLIPHSIKAVICITLTDYSFQMPDYVTVRISPAGWGDWRQCTSPPLSWGGWWRSPTLRGGWWTPPTIHLQ